MIIVNVARVVSFIAATAVAIAIVVPDITIISTLLLLSKQVLHNI